MTVTNSTISGNSAGRNGGGIYISSDEDSRMTVTDSTISGNSARRDGGGIYGETMGIIASTVSGNSAGRNGGGVRGRYIRLNHSIIARNGANGGSSDVLGRLTATNSLIGDNTFVGLSEAPVGMPDADGNLIGDPNGMEGIIDPLLSPLGSFGGSTQTHALLPDSPAINMGDPDFLEPPDHDQRGAPFLRISGGRIDMGAYESQIAPVDFNDDEQLDCADVDALVAAIVEENNPREFDLTGDTLVAQADLDVWLALAGIENLPSHNAYLLGDASLDGKVDANDLNVVGLSWLQDVSGWCSGDVTADGIVDASDLNKLGLNWLQDASGDEDGAAGTRVPRAPLANRVVAAIAAAPLDSQDSVVIVAAPEANLKLSHVDWNVQSGSENVSSSSSHIPQRYMRRELRLSSTRFSTGAQDIHQFQQRDQERLVDLALGQWREVARITQ